MWADCKILQPYLVQSVDCSKIAALHLKYQTVKTGQCIGSPLTYVILSLELIDPFMQQFLFLLSLPNLSVPACVVEFSCLTKQNIKQALSSEISRLKD